MGGDVDKYAKTGNAKLNTRDERDIQKRLESILNDMNSQNAMAFYNGGKEMDKETAELMRVSIENSLRIAKMRAKEKFTPQKYKK